MSKFLKFIVHFVVICTILCVVALAVPPFFGVTTEIRDDSTVKSNLAMGSVTYAIPVKTEDAALGTPILVNDENAVYRYTLASADVANGTGTAMDPTVSQGQPINVAIGSYLPKIVVTIPFIGYLMAATKSIEGLIVLGLTVLFLIILYDKMLLHSFISLMSWSISCSVMSAVSEKRIREVPSGTVGGRTGNA